MGCQYRADHYCAVKSSRPQFCVSQNLGRGAPPGDAMARLRLSEENILHIIHFAIHGREMFLLNSPSMRLISGELASLSCMNF
jgi:hypothetical protein